jgi:hypothetical protein
MRRVLSTVPRWWRGKLGGSVWKKHVRKEGSSQVEPCFAGHRLTMPRIAPAFKTYANSRVRGGGGV